MTLYQVRSNETGVRVVEISPYASALNTNDCFIVCTDVVFLWVGKHTSSETKSAAENAAKILANDRSIQMMEEGHEEDSFWSPLGGRVNYFMLPLQSPHLFFTSNASGAFRAEEIFDFCQDDLDVSKNMILDSGNLVYIWEGIYPTKDEKKDTLQYTMDYLKNHPDGRGKKENWEDLILLLKARKEPITFTGFFFGWDSPDWTPQSESSSLMLAKNALYDYRFASLSNS